MRTHVEPCARAAEASSAASASPCRRSVGGRGRHRKRLLRRAVVGIAGTGWAFFGAPGLCDGSKPTAGTGSTQEIAFDDPASSSLPLGAGLAYPGLTGGPAGRKHRHRMRGNIVAATKFAADVHERLPRYRALFQRAGLSSGIDWRLLAAVAYQESNWNPKAVSPTGVRGIMMLTMDTADEMDVDRENPAESIQGGAQYFQQIRERLPPQIKEPDRTDMALAAYNQGLGHLLDARVLAAQLGGNPNRWQNVRAALPLLAEERWFVKTRHGYAAGFEAVSYVGNVHDYYDLLTSITAEPRPALLQLASNGL